VTADLELSTPNGVRVFLTDTEQLFEDSDGNPVPCSTCQTLRVEVTEALDKSDIIALGIPTNTTSNEMLESGGMVRVAVTCDGSPLELKSDRRLKIQIPANDPAADMLVFNGVFENDNFLGWENSGQQVFQAEWPNANQDIVQGYEILSKNLGWINCGRFINEPTSTFCVELPDNFNPENTQAYIVFKDIRSVAFLQVDLASQKFCFPNTPIGFPVRLVTLSKTSDGQYWLGNYETETGTDNTTAVVIPQETTEQQMLDFLKNL
jgi:hypothetical protein